MKLHASSLSALTVGVFVIGIGATMAFNLWRTESSKVPRTISSGEFAGEYDPGDIRGSYSFADIAAAFEVSTQALSEAFAVDGATAAEFRCNELEDRYGVLEDGGEIGTDSVRWFVALYTGMPYEPEESTRLPRSAMPVLRDRIPEAQRDSVQQALVDLPDGSAAPASVPEPVHTEEDADRSVRGRTTFQDLYDWGLSQARVGAILGIDPGASGMTVRDFAVANELSFSEIKKALQTAVDEMAPQD